MLAGRFPAPGRVELVDIPEPELSAIPAPGSTGEILFEPEISCLCGSDLPYFNGEGPEFPGETGHSLHEMVGRVLATNGKKFRPGDRVLAVPVNQQGLFERYVVSEQRAISIDTRIPYEQAFLAQPLGTVIYAIKKLPTLLDKDVVIVGQGPIGQMFNACARNLGAREIIAIDKLASRLSLSARMGATAVVDTTQQDAVEAVKQRLGGQLADVVVEAVGHADQALNLCITLCKREAKLLSFGVPPTLVEGLTWREAFFRNISLHTSVGPDFDRDFPLAMRWIAEKRLDLTPLITHRYPLADIQTAFETFRDRRDGAQKVVVEFPAFQRAKASYLTANDARPGTR